MASESEDNTTYLVAKGHPPVYEAPMMSARFWIPSVGVFASLVVLVASCGGTQTAVTVATAPSTQLSAAPTPSAAASAESTLPKVDLNDPSEVAVTSWTDDDAIAALAKDCKWDPGGCIAAIENTALQSIEMIDFVPEGEEQSPTDSRVLPKAECQSLRVLACAAVPGQTCVPDECSQSDYQCIPACDTACSSCASKCVTGCESCKAGCKDEACRLTCATSCGECRHSCLAALDQCSTTHCSEEGESCYKTRDDEWNQSVCSKVCPKVQTCVEKCPQIENDYMGQLYMSECAVKCLSKFGKGCPGRFDRICMGDPNASVNFFAYHAAHGGGN